MLKIVELFNGIQGEGLLTGVPSTFVRFAGCNLDCVWCDSEYAVFPEPEIAGTFSVEYTHKMIKGNGLRHVVLTGGEPLIQKEWADLTRFLHCANFHITIETNGTIYPDCCHHPGSPEGGVHLWSVSPKLPSAKLSKGGGVPYSSWLTFYNRYQNVQFKYVIADKGDYVSLKETLSDGALVGFNRAPIILQPADLILDEEGSMDKQFVRSLEMMLYEDRVFWKKYSVRLMLQQHKIFWGNRRAK